MSRTERYKKRCAADGDGTEYVDVDNPLPGFIDPITLEPVVTPAMSPHGHVMGLATWKVGLQRTDPDQCDLHIIARPVSAFTSYSLSPMLGSCNALLRSLAEVFCVVPIQAVLAESKLCPFTKTSMTWEQCTVLTHTNIDRYRDRIKSM